MSENIELKGATTPVFDALILNTEAGDAIDLAPLLLEMSLFEDIFSPVLTGYITIYDTINLFDTLPINGSETLTTKISSWNYSRDKNKDVDYLHRTFDIVRVTDISAVNDYSKQYTLHFASPELKINEGTQISKGFTNRTISDVVKNILSNDLKFGDVIDRDNSVEAYIENSQYVEPVISFPYMKPFDVINYLTLKAQRADNPQAANFLFFENKNGFQFRSIDSLLAEIPDEEKSSFIYGTAAQNKNGRQVFTETINKIQIQDCYDIIRNIRMGLYSSRLYSYNLETGETVEHDYNYVNSFNDTEQQEKYSILSKTNETLGNNALANRIFAIHSPSRDVNSITSEPSEAVNSKKVESGQEEFLQKRTLLPC